jgi:hypothetical protein
VTTDRFITDLAIVLMGDQFEAFDLFEKLAGLIFREVAIVKVKKGLRLEVLGGYLMKAVVQLPGARSADLTAAQINALTWRVVSGDCFEKVIQRGIVIIEFHIT